MPVNAALTYEQWQRFTWCRDHGHIEFVRKADKCDKFVIGDQWRKEDAMALEEQRRPWVTINKLLSTVSTLQGEQIQNRTEVLFRPVAGAPAATADALSKVWMQISQNNQLPWVRSEIFCDGLVRSRGFYDVRLDFTDSLVGEVRITQINSKNVVIDPDAEEYDPDCWNDVFVTKWLTWQDISILYSEEDAEYGKTVGLVENLLGPQEILNKASSQELHVINTTANSGWVIEENSLVNMSVQELEIAGAQTGLVLEYRKDTQPPQKILPNQVPSGLDRITFKAEEHIKTISNVTDTMMGEGAAADKAQRDVVMRYGQSFNRGVLSWANDVMRGKPNQPVIGLVERPAAALRMAGLHRPILIDLEHARHIFNTHSEVTPEMLAALPGLLNTPRAILKYPNSTGLVLDQRDGEGQPLLIALRLTQLKDGKQVFKVTEVATLFGMEESAYLIAQAAIKGDLIYLPKKEVARLQDLLSKALIASQGVETPTTHLTSRATSRSGAQQAVSSPSSDGYEVSVASDEALRKFTLDPKGDWQASKETFALRM